VKISAGYPATCGILGLGAPRKTGLVGAYPPRDPRWLPSTFRTAVPNWSAGDTIPLGRDRTVRVVDVRSGPEPDKDLVLVVEAA